MKSEKYLNCEQEADKIANKYKNKNKLDVVSHMEKEFNTDFSGINFYSKPSLGNNAYAKGKDVFFGQGMDRPEVIAHELVHTMQQGYGSGTAMLSQSAPEGSVQGWGLPEHNMITELAYKLANKDAKKDKKYESIMAGAKFNDVRHYSTAGFLIKYLNHKDEYINQSHHGGLQAIHAMNSTGSAKENYLQQKAYAEFCIDVGSNKEIDGQSILKQPFLEYVNNSNESLKRMFYPMFIKHDVLKTIENESNGDSELVWEGILEALNNPENHSRFALMTVEEFFTGGNKNLDASMVAQGSLAHMVEDSFANSHAQRTGNAVVGDSGIREALENEALTEEFLTNPDKILGSTTKIMLHQDYNEQHTVLQGAFGKHEHGDGFEEAKKPGFFQRIKNFFTRKKNKKPKKPDTVNEDMLETQGAMQAQMSVAYIFRKMSEGKADDVRDFVDKILAVDENSLILDEITQDRKKGVSGEELKKKAEKSDAFRGLDVDKFEFSFTKGGRQYERTFESDGGWMYKEKNPRVKKMLRQYNSMLDEESYNKIFEPEVLAKKYLQQAEIMSTIFYSDASNETMERLSCHGIELLTHIASLTNQLKNIKPELAGKLQQIRDVLVNAMNIGISRRKSQKSESLMFNRKSKKANIV